MPFQVQEASHLGFIQKTAIQITVRQREGYVHDRPVRAIDGVVIEAGAVDGRVEFLGLALVDLRNIYDPGVMRDAGLEYMSIGR